MRSLKSWLLKCWLLLITVTTLGVYKVSFYLDLSIYLLTVPIPFFFFLDFLKKLYVCLYFVLCVCLLAEIYVHCMCTDPTEVRRGERFSGNWSFKQV